MKYHQLFKKELEVSFFEFSCDRGCTCPIHTNFGMDYIDIQASHDSLFLAGNRFCIQIDIIEILSKLKEHGLNKKESISSVYNQLFKFYQNNRLGYDITNPLSEY